MDTHFKSLRKVEKLFDLSIPDKELQQKLILNRVLDSYLEKSSFPIYIKGMSFEDMLLIFKKVKKEQNKVLKEMLIPNESTSCFQGLFAFNINEIEKNVIKSNEIKNLIINKTGEQFYSHLVDVIDNEIDDYSNKFCDMSQYPVTSNLKYLLKYSSETLLKINDKEIAENKNIDTLYNKKIYNMLKNFCENHELLFISFQNKNLLSELKIKDKIVNIENLLTEFQKETMIPKNKFGMNKLGLIFNDYNILNEKESTQAVFMKNNGNDFYGSIIINEDLRDTIVKKILKIEHEYLHALDYHIGYKICKKFNNIEKRMSFTELPINLKSNYLDINNKIREMLYFISDQEPMECELIIQKNINNQLIKVLKNLSTKKTIKEIRDIISENLDFIEDIKIIVNHYTYNNMYNLDVVLKEIILQKPKFKEIFSEFTDDKYLNNLKNKKSLKKVLEECVIKMDINLNAYYVNPSYLTLLIGNKNHNDRKYMKQETERLAWLSNIKYILLGKEEGKFLKRELQNLYKMFLKVE